MLLLLQLLSLLLLSCSSELELLICKRELIHIRIFAGFTAYMVNSYHLYLLQPSPAMAYFSPLPRLLLSVGVILALWCQSFTSEMTVSRICHVTALFRLKETIEGTDWCKVSVMVHITSNLQCFVLDPNSKGLCQTRTDLRH